MIIRITTRDEHIRVGEILDALHFQFLPFEYEITKFSVWTKGFELPFTVHVFQSTYREFNVLNSSRIFVMPASEFIDKPINYALTRLNRK